MKQILIVFAVFLTGFLLLILATSLIWLGARSLWFDPVLSASPPMVNRGPLVQRIESPPPADSAAGTGQASPAPARPETSAWREPADGDVYLPFEAESYADGEGFTILGSPAASDGCFVMTDRSEEGVLRIPFELTREAFIVVWFRIRAPTAEADSFYVAMNNGRADVFDAAEDRWSEDWQWVPLNGRGDSGSPLALNPRIFRLRAGAHVLTIRGREANSQLDRVLVTGSFTSGDDMTILGDSPVVLETPPPLEPLPAADAAAVVPGSPPQPDAKRPDGDAGSGDAQPQGRIRPER